MRHVFILNPVAGKHEAALALIPEIEAACKDCGCEYTLRQTASPGDTAAFAKEEAAKGDVRLYACGGDGTLLDVLSGVGPDSGIEVAHIPCGSGNDFVRMLGGSEPFLNIREMLRSAAVPVDGICCEQEGQPPRYALNVAATGMDGAVAYDMVRFKRWPLVSGSMAYDLALVKVFCGRLGCSLKVKMDTPEGEVSLSGRYLFALSANGQYYGGGYRGAPEACPNDGLLDFVLVDKISRLKMLTLLPHYKAGTHLGKPGIHWWRGTSMTVTADRPIAATLDGECFLTNQWTVRVCPGAYRMVMPAEIAEKLHKEPAVSPV